MDENKYSVSVKAPIGAPPEYHKHALESGRRKAGNELYNILYSQKMPAVVDIHEKVIPARDSFGNLYPENELRIEITVTPVQHHHVTITHADMDLNYRASTLLAQLKWKVKRFIWKLRRK